MGLQTDGGSIQVCQSPEKRGDTLVIAIRNNESALGVTLVGAEIDYFISTIQELRRKPDTPSSEEIPA